MPVVETPKLDAPASPPGGGLDTESKQPAPINLDPFPGLTESIIIDWAKACNESWERYFTGGTDPGSRRIELYNKLFLCQNAAPNMPHLPIPNSIVETLQANIMHVLTARPKVVEAKARFFTQDNERQQLIEDLVNQQILFQEDARRKISGIAKGAAISEYSIVKSSWENYSSFDFKPVYTLINGTQKMTDEGEIEVKRGRWVYEQVPQLGFAFDPDTTTTLPKASWTRHRDFKAISELLMMEQAGKLQNVSDLIGDATKMVDSDQRNKVAKQRQALGAGRGDGPESKVQIDEFYAVISWKDDTQEKETWLSERFHFMIAGEQKLIMFDKCGLKPDRNPYILARIMTKPDSLAGNSVLISVVDMEEQANLSLARKRDLVTKAADNPTFYEPASGFDPSKTRGRTGGYVMVGDASKINRMPVDSEPIRILNEDIGSMVTMMRESTPANEQFQGNGPENNTATQANIDYQVGGVRFGEIVDTFSDDLFPALAREFFWQAKQFSQDGDLYVSQSSIDGNVRPITLADLTGEWDFIASGMQAEANKKNNTQGKIEIAKMIMDLAGRGPGAMIDSTGKPVRFDFWKFITEDLMPPVGLRNGKSLIKPLPTPQPMPPAGGPMPGGPAGMPQLPPQEEPPHQPMPEMVPAPSGGAPQ